MTVLALVEHVDAHPTDTTRQALTLARGLADAAGTGLEAAVLDGDGPAVAETLRAEGVDRVHACAHELLEAYAPEAWGETLAQLVAGVEPRLVVAAGTDRATEVMAHAAARSDRPLAAGCVAVHPTDGGWSLTRQRWGGVLWEDAELTGAPALLTVAPHAVAAAPADQPGDAAVKDFRPELDATLARTRVTDVRAKGTGVTLATAPVVVSGGRGVGSAEGFAVLEELAGLLGGTVGCSRVVTNNGWRPHSDQVGQTGTRVAPDLYLACGISGATQHWVGCKDSKRILALNTDPEAAMVTRADYAVIGDVQEVLAAVVEEVKARQRAGARA